MFYRKSRKYHMDLTQADKTLQNVFAACEQAPNTVPFDKIILRNKLNTQKYNTLILAILIALILTFAAPLIVIPLSDYYEKMFPTVEVELSDSYRDGNLLYLVFVGDDIIYEDAYLETVQGEKYNCISYDKDTKTIIFPYISDMESNIYVPVKYNSTKHFLLSPE